MERKPTYPGTNEAAGADVTQHVERQPVTGARFEDLNLNLVREHIEGAIKRRGYSGTTDPEAYLVQHGCLIYGDDERPIPTLAGLVCFAREPHLRVSVCGIDLAQFSSSSPHTAELVLSRQIRGDLFTIIDKTIDLLWARTEHRTEIIGSERVEVHAYP
ncbi:MAG: hypothetical protein EOM24_15130, partial [Chloroflexia bacterium]|nr:hypothetical protein [Chloroflexia bacterium]